MYRIILLLLIPLNIFAQSIPKSTLPTDSTTNLITYKIIESVPELNKQALYSNAKTWIAKNFNAANRVTQMDDVEGGKLIVKAFTPYYSYVKSKHVDFKLWFTISISVKDGKYKGVLTDFISQQTGEEDRVPAELLVKPSLTELGWLDITVAIEDFSKIFLSSISSTMKTKDDF